MLSILSCPSVRLMGVKAISQERFEEISSNVAQSSTIEDELIMFSWAEVKDQGHCCFISVECSDRVRGGGDASSVSMSMTKAYIYITMNIMSCSNE